MAQIFAQRLLNFGYVLAGMEHTKNWLANKLLKLGLGLLLSAITVCKLYLL
jgi:hypothetical protein